MNSDEHKWGTGVANELILENARKIASDGGKLHVRIPLMPGYNTDDENILATRDFCLEIKEAVQLVQLLPFHNLGSAKYERLSTAAPELQTQAPDEELVGRISEMFTSAGFKVVVH
jgi:pyruvate formate lyase activating enzyme